MASTALAPETVEGWYALHQIFTVDDGALGRMHADERHAIASAWAAVVRAEAAPAGGGWSAVVPLIGSTSDVMLVHFRPTLDAIGVAQHRIGREPLSAALKPVQALLSIAEASLYHVTVEMARATAERGGQVGDPAYREALETRLAAERQSAAVQRRIHPSLPKDMPYVSFYSMSKRRAAGQNWYSLPIEERIRLMHAQGMTGRKFAGRLQQVITGSIGLDRWEWGVTLFAKDPLDFKKLAAETRFDEVSAQYAEFGEAYVGKVVGADEWVGGIC